MPDMGNREHDPSSIETHGNVRAASTLPRVVVGIPVYNGEAYIRTAVESVLNQDYDNLNLLVVDNASSDATCSLVRTFKDPRVSLQCFTDFVPVASNWSRTLQLAKGDFFMFLSADNALEPGAISALVAALVNDPTSDVAIGGSHYVFEEGAGRELARPLRPPRPGGLGNLELHVLRYGNNFLTDAVMFRTGIPELHIKGDEGLTSDLELLVRLGQAGARAVAISDIVCSASIHVESVSAKNVEVIWHARIGSFIKLRATSTQKRAYSARIGRALVWGTAALLRKRDVSAASRFATTYLRETSLQWQSIVKLMLALPVTTRAAYAIRVYLQR